MKGKSLAIRRINKDMKEINQNPIEGIGISSLDNDPMKYVVNIKLMNGPYKDYCVQLYLTFPETYPSKPPKILIYPGQAIDGQYHHHIFDDYSLIDTLCPLPRQQQNHGSTAEKEDWHTQNPAEPRCRYYNRRYTEMKHFRDRRGKQASQQYTPRSVRRRSSFRFLTGQRRIVPLTQSLDSAQGFELCQRNQKERCPLSRA